MQIARRLSLTFMGISETRRRSREIENLYRQVISPHAMYSTSLDPALRMLSKYTENIPREKSAFLDSNSI